MSFVGLKKDTRIDGVNELVNTIFEVGRNTLFLSWFSWSDRLTFEFQNPIYENPEKAYIMHIGPKSTTGLSLLIENWYWKVQTCLRILVIYIWIQNIEFKMTKTSSARVQCRAASKACQKVPFSTSPEPLHIHQVKWEPYLPNELLPNLYGIWQNLHWRERDLHRMGQKLSCVVDSVVWTSAAGVWSWSPSSSGGTETKAATEFYSLLFINCFVHYDTPHLLRHLSSLLFLLITKLHSLPHEGAPQAFDLIFAEMKLPHATFESKMEVGQDAVQFLAIRDRFICARE